MGKTRREVPSSPVDDETGPEDVRDFGVSQAQRDARAKREAAKHLRHLVEILAEQINSGLREYQSRMIFVK